MSPHKSLHPTVLSRRIQCHSRFYGSFSVGKILCKAARRVNSELLGTHKPLVTDSNPASAIIVWEEKWPSS